MNDSRLEQISTANDVLEALGGGTKAARLAGCSPQNLSNAIRRGRLPPSTFVIFTEALRACGLAAPPELWGIKSESADPRQRGVEPVKRRV